MDEYHLPTFYDDNTVAWDTDPNWSIFSESFSTELCNKRKRNEISDLNENVARISHVSMRQCETEDVPEIHCEPSNNVSPYENENLETNMRSTSRSTDGSDIDCQSPSQSVGARESANGGSLTPENEAERETRDPASSTLELSTSITRDFPTYLLPSAVFELSTLKAGSFIAGYVVDSSGSGSNSIAGPETTGKNSNANPPSKKRKQSTTLWHALHLADEKHIVKLWSRAQPNAAPNRIATVNRLSKVKTGSFVAIYVQFGPIEVSISNPAFKKYDLCTKDCELISAKLKLFTPSVSPSIPVFSLATSDAYNPRNWEEIDSIVHNSGNSFEINCNFAVIGLNGRHTMRKAKNGSRYLTGYIQDCDGVSRFVSIFAHIDAFLEAIPENVNVKHVIVEFKRLRIRTMVNASSSNPARVASLTTNTSFRVLSTSFEDFSNEAPRNLVSFSELDGFE